MKVSIHSCSTHSDWDRLLSVWSVFPLTRPPFLAQKYVFNEFGYLTWYKIFDESGTLSLCEQRLYTFALHIHLMQSHLGASSHNTNIYHQDMGYDECRVYLLDVVCHASHVISKTLNLAYSMKAIRIWMFSGISAVSHCLQCHHRAHACIDRDIPYVEMARKSNQMGLFHPDLHFRQIKMLSMRLCLCVGLNTQYTTARYHIRNVNNHMWELACV